MKEGTVIGVLDVDAEEAEAAAVKEEAFDFSRRPKRPRVPSMEAAGPEECG